MNKEDIIRMAKNSGLFVELVLERDLDWLERFAKLVAEHEREACAKMCEMYVNERNDEARKTATKCVIDIRARGQA
jgi:pyrroloquinoline quinone (PQQ) biosynthesis protein C